MEVCRYVSKHTDTKQASRYGKWSNAVHCFGNSSSHQVHLLMQDQIKPVISISNTKKVFDMQDAATLQRQAGQLMPANIYAMKSRFHRQMGTIKLSWNKLTEH